MSHVKPRIMQRYSGGMLGSSPHIVVLGSCKVGNFVVSTPTLDGLRSRFPDAVIGFIGSEVTADLETAHPSIDWRMSWDSTCPQPLKFLSEIFSYRLSLHGPVALAVNLDGFNPVTQVLVSLLSPQRVAGMAFDASRRRLLPLGDTPNQLFLHDPDWDSASFTERYPGVFSSNYIAEFFSVLAGVNGHCDPTQISLPHTAPPFVVPDILIHCTTARSAKIWPFQYWKIVLDDLYHRGLSVGLVGSPPNYQRDVYNSGDGEEWLLQETTLRDLRGKTNLLELAGACQSSRGVISVDAGPLHIAAAMGTPTLAVVGNDSNGVGASPIRLWMPRCENAERTMSSFSCSLCAEERFANDACLLADHPCMTGVDPYQVIAWIDRLVN